jgi:hypothetical protein
MLATRLAAILETAMVGDGLIAARRVASMMIFLSANNRGYKGYKKTTGHIAPIIVAKIRLTDPVCKEGM